MRPADIVIPIFNEEECLPELLRRLHELRAKTTDWQLNFIFVNDGSRDRSEAILREQAGKHAFVRVIHFARNFGHQAAISAGLDAAEADYVAIIDGDLQDPPELIPQMLARLGPAADVVYGQRRSRAGESWFKLTTARLFYRFLSAVLKVDIPKDTGDFRVVTRRVVLAIRQMRERHRFLRGMVPWLGFRAEPFLYDRDRRYAGETKFGFMKMARFALDAIFAFSNHPLRLATYLGLFLTFAGFFFGLVVLYLRLFTSYTVPGISAVLFAVLVIGGLQSFILGISGEYIGRLYEQVKARPLYVVDYALNLPSPGMPRPPGSA